MTPDTCLHTSNELVSKWRSVEAQCNITALFAGIGGLELGLSKSGHRATLLCEINPSARAVLKSRFAGVPLVNDVRDRETLLASIQPDSNLLTAGFPCTDISQAGLTLGFSGKQSGLIVDVLDLIRARPFDSILIENVPNWRFLHSGQYLASVLDRLEKMGYRWAYRVIDALAFGLPQRRQRVFLFATKTGDPREVLFHGSHQPVDVEYRLKQSAHGFYWTEGNRGLGWGEDCIPTLKGGSGLGIPSSPAILLPDGRIITPDIRDAERLQGFPIGWTDIPIEDAPPIHHRRRWALVGNAINVEVAKWIGKNLRDRKPYTGDAGFKCEMSTSFPQAAWFDGANRYRVELSTWPVRRERRSLAEFLKFEGKSLSHRATQGFYSRASKSSLRFVDGFLPAVERHMKRMERSQREARVGRQEFIEA